MDAFVLTAGNVALHNSLEVRVLLARQAWLMIGSWVPRRVTRQVPGCIARWLREEVIKLYAGFEWEASCRDLGYHEIRILALVSGIQLPHWRMLLGFNLIKFPATVDCIGLIERLRDILLWRGRRKGAALDLCWQDIILKSESLKHRRSCCLLGDRDRLRLCVTHCVGGLKGLVMCFRNGFVRTRFVYGYNCGVLGLTLLY